MAEKTPGLFTRKKSNTKKAQHKFVGLKIKIEKAKNRCRAIFCIICITFSK